MATQDDLNTSAIALVGFVGAVLVFAVIVVLMIIFHRVEARQRSEKEVEPAYGRVTQLAADQQGRLADYGWIDREKRIARVPIQRAMELVVDELSENPEADVIGAPLPTPDATDAGPEPGLGSTPPDNAREPDDAKASDNAP